MDIHRAAKDRYGKPYPLASGGSTNPEPLQRSPRLRKPQPVIAGTQQSEDEQLSERNSGFTGNFPEEKLEGTFDITFKGNRMALVTAD